MWTAIFHSRLSRFAYVKRESDASVSVFFFCVDVQIAPMTDLSSGTTVLKIFGFRDLSLMWRDAFVELMDASIKKRRTSPKIELWSLIQRVKWSNFLRQFWGARNEKERRMSRHLKGKGGGWEAKESRSPGMFHLFEAGSRCPRLSCRYSVEAVKVKEDKEKSKNLRSR